ncbi:MAG: hypothetical protein SH819_01065 [Cytophagales bacterium]|nr:hypothetical protein [Cytophagales bacterium]
MKTTSNLAILESLDAMDTAQKERVLHYIREIFQKEPPRRARLRRQQAMEQIRKALHPGQALRAPLF